MIPLMRNFTNKLHEKKCIQNCIKEFNKMIFFIKGNVENSGFAWPLTSYIQLGTKFHKLTPFNTSIYKYGGNEIRSNN